MEINVEINSKLNIICPNPANVLSEQDSSIPKEQLYENMWIVTKHEYDTCRVNTSSLSNRNVLSCQSPLQLKYYEMVFRSYSAQPGGLEFTPGTKYYFIGKADVLTLVVSRVSVFVFVVAVVFFFLIGSH